ncbi:MAG: sigma-54 dependent transcriptional regulator [Deltaproteobacteria bacterium]|jgi:DNA-binding NtrC family response regulator|nr:sigma-54 dependent transcriptional regulator [Deltaproteobacteria bacterium]
MPHVPTLSAEILRQLAFACARLANGDYSEARSLFSLTESGKYPPEVTELAESFGLMLVRVEARDFELSKTVAELDAACKKLARGKTSLSRENQKLRAVLEKHANQERLVSKSRVMKTLLDQAALAAGVNSTVLITGETGTGKGVLARHIHRAGARAKGPFVVVNCAAIPSSLLESEIFGIEKGVASGVDARMGRFEQASGGSIFLDEIGDLSLESQAKILHVLESNTVERIGGRSPLPVDARIIAATHRDLTTACARGEFRSDLYYRLNVIHLHIPALRERLEDIPPLARFFLENCALRNPSPARSIGKEALAVLEGYAWPGNIRELANEIERAVLLAASVTLEPSDLSAALFSRQIPPPGLSKMERSALPAPAPGAPPSLDLAESALLRQTLAHAGGNKSRAARLLGISREGLRKKLKRFKLVP